MEATVQNIWSKSKLLIKSGIIGGIILILQIPVFYVTSLIEEREKRQQEAINEVSSKWAARQNIMGPVIVLPYWENTTNINGKVQRTMQSAYFLPDELNMEATATPQEKYRGIYKVMLYNSKINVNGSFSSLPLQKLGILPDQVLWNEAYLSMSVSDNKGLNEELKLKLNDSLVTLQALPSGNEGLSARITLNPEKAAQPISFSTSFGLNGSEQLLFTPAAKATSVQLKSTWAHPSFTGNSLPQNTAVSDSGFSATWRSMGFKQTFPQQWKGNGANLTNNFTNNTASPASISNAAFGVSLFVPVNGYQKTMRSIKYSFLCLILTFAAFFLIEISNRTSAHPFHYGLIGLALILFYTLLLSVSEYISFNPAYVIASICTIGLIAWFVRSLLHSGKLAVLLSCILVLLYSYVFTILQLQDYSLLLGSIGLFITLAVVMHFSKRFRW